MTLRFRHSRAGVLQIGEDALGAMLSFAQHAPDSLEAGGLLLGRLLRGGRDVVIDSVTVPMEGDERTRFTFFRTAEGHQRIIDEVWEASGGTTTFLGDWHTHAEPRPSPSGVDLENWVRMLREDKRDDEACFFLIVGQVEIVAWEGNHRTGEVRKLSPM